VLTLGGLGKSTLANQVYTKMKSMEVFSDDSSKYVTFDLDSKSKDNAVVDAVHRWLSYQTGPVLLLLDNVQHQRQLDDILNDTNLEDKSFVLATSRRRDLVASIHLYEMPTMGAADALELFRWYSQGHNSSGVIQTSKLKVCSIDFHSYRSCTSGTYAVQR
jgi:AAA domain